MFVLCSIEHVSCCRKSPITEKIWFKNIIPHSVNTDKYCSSQPQNGLHWFLTGKCSSSSSPLSITSRLFVSCLLHCILISCSRQASQICSTGLLVHWSPTNDANHRLLIRFWKLPGCIIISYKNWRKISFFSKNKFLRISFNSRENIRFGESRAPSCFSLSPPMRITESYLAHPEQEEPWQQPWLGCFFELICNGAIIILKNYNKNSK